MYLEISERCFSGLLDLFFDTYAFYYDRYSRKAVQQCIRTIFSKGIEPELLSQFIRKIQNEASKPGLAPSNAFVLVEWFSILLQECIGTKYWAEWGLELISSDAQVLELCQSASARRTMKLSAMVITRRAIRKIFSSQDSWQHSIRDAILKLTAKGTQQVSRNSIMLGVIAGVSARRPESKAVIESTKSEISSFYIRDVLGSRTPVPAHIASGLHEFLHNFIMTSDDVEKLFIPSVEKSLLRAPEIVLNDLLTPLFHSLPKTVDLSNSLCNNLLKPLLSNIKSSNVAIRQGAITAFKAAVRHCHREDSLKVIADEILNPLKSGKLPSADHRAMHAEMLAALPISEQLAKIILSSVAAVATKETNEVALGAEILLLTRYSSWCLNRDVGVEKVVVDAFAKGLSDKKVQVRRLWAILLGEVLWTIQDSNLESENIVSVVEVIFPGLLELWNEVVANPIATAQSGLVTGAFVLTALAPSKLDHAPSGNVRAELKKAQVTSQALAYEPKPSFLLNHRIYSKLSNEDDFLWLVRALVAMFEKEENLDLTSPVAIAWSQAIIFCICSINSSSAVRRQSMDALSRLYVRLSNKISTIVVNGLWHWIQSIEGGEKDSAAAAAKSDNVNLHYVVRSICLSPMESKRFGAEISASSREQQMVSLLVLARPELIPRVNWIRLCLTVEIDPGDLARKYSNDLMNQIIKLTSFSETVSSPYLIMNTF